MGPPAALERLFTCWGGHADAVKAVSPAAIILLAAYLAVSACLRGRKDLCRCRAWFPGMFTSPAAIPELVALLTAPTGTTWHGERSLAALPCHVCVGKAAHPAAGEREEGCGEVAWPRSMMWPRSIPCGPCAVPQAPVGPGRITQAVLRHVSLGTEVLPAAAGELLGARGDAARVARCPGQAPCLPLLARPLSDRHISAALGGQGSLGRGTQAGDTGRLQMMQQWVWICCRSVLGCF